MKSVIIGLSVAIVAYTETMKRIENEQESELKKQTTYVFHSRVRSGIEILSVLFCVKHIFQHELLSGKERRLALLQPAHDTK